MNGVGRFLVEGMAGKTRSRFQKAGDVHGLGRADLKKVHALGKR
jgi:hypothetical protein